MKPITGELIISGHIESRAFLWKILIKGAAIEGLRVFKSQATARNDAIRMAKRLNISVVEKV